MTPTIFAVLLLALALWALYTAPALTIGAALTLGIATQPHVTAVMVATFATLTIALGLLVIWRNLSDSGWRLVMVATRPA